jgi:hypothetical protein
LELSCNVMVNGKQVRKVVRKLPTMELNIHFPKKPSKIRAAWLGAKKRCFNSNDTGFHYWGGRVITMCDEWKDNFAAFASYLGDAPGPEYSLDRINNNGNYEPGNVRWATRSQQNSNTRPRLRPSNKEKAHLINNHCKRGHEFSPENTYIPPSKPESRQCKTCRRASPSQTKQKRQ